MTPPAQNPSQGRFLQEISDKIVQNAQVFFNIGVRIITITEDKVELAVHKYLAQIRRKNAWNTPLGIVVSIGLILATGSFRDALGISAAMWNSLYLLLGIGALFWLLLEIYRAIKSPSVEDFVAVLRASQVPMPYPQVEPNLLLVLTSSTWILHFDPPKGKKPITFEQGGMIGEGRNNNEHSWRLAGNKLEIFNSNGFVFSRFIYDQPLQKWTRTTDPDTKPLPNQYIEKVY
jgi:hypothetical protein